MCRRRKGKLRCLKGSMTVEMSFLAPILFLLIMSSILAGFYFHDKNVIAGAAYETAVVGSTKMREKDKVTSDMLGALFRERVRGKCILFSAVRPDISVTEKEITVYAAAHKGRFGVSVVKRAVVTDPEKHIRDIRRIKEIADGAEDHD